MSPTRAALLDRLEAERHRPVPPPPPGACDHGPTAWLMQHERQQRQQAKARRVPRLPEPSTATEEAAR